MSPVWIKSFPAIHITARVMKDYRGYQLTRARNFPPQNSCWIFNAHFDSHKPEFC
jgi:hypothetical protein